MKVDCAIIGGGLAGLQAAVQLGRYRHSTIVIDAGDGRAHKCRRYHNLLAFPDGISGGELLERGREQLLRLGVKILAGEVTALRKQKDDSFVLTLRQGEPIEARCVLLATGVKDRIPNLPSLIPCLGISVFICPDCDGYEIAGKSVLVLGTGDAGARMAQTLLHWSDSITYINDECKPMDEELREKLEKRGVAIINDPIVQLNTIGAKLTGVEVSDGRTFKAEGAFVAYGGNEVRSSLAEQAGAELMPNRHVRIDGRTKMTTVAGLFAAGDVAPHSEQAAIAMGDGLQAAIWMHKILTEGV